MHNENLQNVGHWSISALKDKRMKKIEKTTWQYLNAVTRKGKINIVILLLAQAILGISSIFYAFFLRDIINEAVAGNGEGFFRAVAAFALLVCAQLLVRALTRFLEEHTRASVENCAKERLFATLMEKEYQAVAAVHSGEWMNRLTGDTVVVANGITEILPGLTGMIVRLVGALSAIVVLEPGFLYLIVPGGILLIGFSYAFRKVLKEHHNHVRNRDGSLYMYMQESLSGMLVVRSYGVEAAVAKEASGKMEDHKRARIKKNHFSNICNTGFGLVMNGAYVLGALWGGYGILKGTMTYGSFMAVIQLIGQIQYPFANISGFLPRFYGMMASCERLMEAEAYKGPTEETKTAEETREMYQEQMKSLVISDVSFSYGEDENRLQVLTDIHFAVQKGDCVAFVGDSGCGKSTLLKLIMGVYEPKSGSIWVEMQDEKKASVREWKRLFAYVPQGNHLMSGTIRDVVRFHREAPGAGMTVEEALKLACADFVWELPEGIETVLGEKGAGLSEGQMQRIAIARALYADAPVLIFDEATSALDEMTEKRLLEQLKQLTNKTILIATHRKAVLDICNKQLIFVDGKPPRIMGE